MTRGLACICGLCVGASAIPAAGSVGYGITSIGSVYAFDTQNPAATAFRVSAPVTSADGVARDPSTGMLWAIGWNGNFYRIDPSAGTWTAAGLVPRPGNTGFYKDLSWDPVNSRLLATHLGTAGSSSVNRIVVIDPITVQHTVLAEITGLAGFGPQALGLAVDGRGFASIFNFADASIYDLGAVPITPVGTMPATRRPVQSFPIGFEILGLEYDQSSGQLYASGQGLYEIRTDGTASLQPGFGSPSFFDMTFVPAPSAGWLAVATTALVGARRRSRPR